uniref:Uncharacterized protein n=1 Tax=Clytia hemisphaerica TaxID=252671 RepID=A0A7M5XKS7_9CNID
MDSESSLDIHNDVKDIGKENLLKALEEAEILIGDKPKRSWQKRTESNEKKWLEAKDELSKQVIFKQEKTAFCFNCGKDKAEIRSFSCTPMLFLCSTCDTEVHKMKGFHDRQ